MLRPYVIVFVTMSADGKIASKTGESRLSCYYDKVRLHKLRASVDAVMVGANTVVKDDPELTVRLASGKNPLRVVVDGKLVVPINAKVFDVSKAPTLLITSNKAPEDKVKAITSKGVEVIALESEGWFIKPNLILHTLYNKGVKTLLIEGGGNLIWNFIKEKLVDEFRITISPYIVGGKESVTPVEGEGFTDVNSWLKLELVSYKICACGNEIHITYKVKT